MRRCRKFQKGKVHITQNKHVPIEIDCDFLTLSIRIGGHIFWRPLSHPGQKENSPNDWMEDSKIRAEHFVCAQNGTLCENCTPTLPSTTLAVRAAPPREVARIIYISPIARLIFGLNAPEEGCIRCLNASWFANGTWLLETSKRRTWFVMLCLLCFVRGACWVKLEMNEAAATVTYTEHSKANK